MRLGVRKSRKADTHRYRYIRGRLEALTLNEVIGVVNKEILDRVVCAKYMYETSTGVLQRGAPYAAGLAVSGFQDAVEIVLRAACEWVHAPVHEHSQFNTLMDKIEEAKGIRLTHRSALNQLNKARVNFKHSGLAPRDEDAWKFSRDLSGFFPQFLYDFLGLDFDSLSLTSLVKHKRTRNWLDRSDALLGAGDLYGSVRASAIALRVFMSVHGRQKKIGGLSGITMHARLNGVGVERNFLQFAEELNNRLSEVMDELSLVGGGVQYDEYRRFMDLTPNVSLSIAGTLHVDETTYAPAFEQALFCNSFAKKLVLKFQEHYRKSRRVAPGNRVVVTKTSEVIVYPSKGSDIAEIIDEVSVGSEFTSFPDYSRDGFVAIWFDEAVSYIQSDATSPT